MIKKGYHPRTNLVKDKKGDWVTDCHSILARWRNHFSQLLSGHGLKLLGRQKYIQQNHQGLSQVPLKSSWILKS